MIKRIIVGIVIAVLLGIAFWIGWPRDKAPVNESPSDADFNVGQQDDFSAPERNSGTQIPSPDTEAEAQQPAPGDPVDIVTAEPDFDETAPSAPIQATWNDTVRIAAQDAAHTTMTAFAATDQSESDWWAGLKPLLTPQAQPIYQDIDPRLIPVTQVTGDPTVTDETSTLLTEVTVPTDIGAYTVLLTRIDGGAPWLAEQIRPPEGS